ncbi:single-stranded DNA-binding protein [Nakamurella antarctica]|uniref:Single-stranded DNA-binding protein n=1 Tax=Nakamurella antarctica TaxID=1902245 RepID=A0A3G8ZY59_9ACTN|nr:R3H domain-containing nucleic acid-binding protein [Nakamurella antarctica]AZI59284.1 single-stranded DNA-binding protein [Nakamurella antarctica]
MTENTGASDEVVVGAPEVHEGADSAVVGRGDDSNSGTEGAVEGSSEDAVEKRAPRSRKAATGELLVEEGDAAGDYLERLLDILDYDGDIDLDVEGERAVVSIIGGDDLDKLVGDRGVVLDALQELTRLAAAQETDVRSRLMLDIAGFRAQRRLELSALGQETAAKVLADGEEIKLASMNPFERKIVHDAVGLVEGVVSSSEGEEPRRRVVVSLAS